MKGVSKYVRSQHRGFVKVLYYKSCRFIYIDHNFTNLWLSKAKRAVVNMFHIEGEAGDGEAGVRAPAARGDPVMVGGVRRRAAGQRAGRMARRQDDSGLCYFHGVAPKW